MEDHEGMHDYEISSTIDTIQKCLMGLGLKKIYSSFLEGEISKQEVVFIIHLKSKNRPDIREILTFSGLIY